MATAPSIAEARVTRPWRTSYDPTLAVVRGERLTLLGEDEDWRGWWWAVNADGLGGWLPAGILDPAAPGPSVASAAFDTRELTVVAGVRVATADRCAGWTWCTAPDGRAGWVPDSCLERGADP